MTDKKDGSLCDYEGCYQAKGILSNLCRAHTEAQKRGGTQGSLPVPPPITREQQLEIDLAKAREELQASKGALTETKGVLAQAKLAIWEAIGTPEDVSETLPEAVDRALARLKLATAVAEVAADPDGTPT